MTEKHKETRELSPGQRQEFLSLLKDRFDKYPERHKQLNWIEIQSRLESDPLKLRSLYEMEKTGGEPDVVYYDSCTGEYHFYDCSAESPEDRRNTCYDRQAQESRKENRPQHNAMDMADEMGIEMLTEEQYRELQRLGNFDQKTSSWVKTPPEIRKLGGALFCDRRYNHVFVYHNGASSYYAVRGFRGRIII